MKKTEDIDTMQQSDPAAPVNLGIFVKEPRPGSVKTRLARGIGAAAAAELYRAFVADTLTLALNSPARHCRIFHAGLALTHWLPDPWPGSASSRFSESAQPEGDLGARLNGAFESGPMPMLILGSDSPDLPATHVASALETLAGGASLVLGAVEDGGVWCIGLKRPHADLFRSIPWSSPATGDALRNRADELGLNRAEAAPWYDCDLQEDLDALALRLRQHPDGATMTRRCLHLDEPEPGPEST
jgi:rSAM/selenodomain-associated transferase 1